MNTPTQHTESWQSPQPAPDNHKLKPPHQIPNTERKFREDSDCGAMLEGPNRATRGANYLNYIHSIAPNTASTQRRIVVNGVDHDGDAIFNDSAVRQALFNSGGAGDAASRVSTTGEGSTSPATTTPAASDSQSPITASSSSASSSDTEQSAGTSSDDTREQ